MSSSRSKKGPPKQMPISPQQRLIDDSFGVRKKQAIAKEDKRAPKRTAAGKTAAAQPPPAVLTTDELDLLSKFDVCPAYGPSAGNSRLQRWERAQRFDKSPPTEVKTILTSLPPCVHHNKIPALCMLPLNLAFRRQGTPSTLVNLGRKDLGRSIAFPLLMHHYIYCSASYLWPQV